VMFVRRRGLTRALAERFAAVQNVLIHTWY
jgi:hypothetical protein